MPLAHTMLIGVLTLVAAGVPSAQRAPAGAPRLTATAFRTLMQTVASGWNRNDARRAADCFAEDARYSAHPDTGIRGRAALYEFFGGPTGRPRPMRMEWHDLVFDEASQVGIGEFTFEYGPRTHGLVVVRIVDGQIADWREHEHESPVTWDELVTRHRF